MVLSYDYSNQNRRRRQTNAPPSRAISIAMAVRRWTGFDPSWSSLCCLGFFSGTSLCTRRLAPIFYGKLRPAGGQTIWLLRFMLQLTPQSKYSTLCSNNTHEQKKTPFLPYRSICYAGIVQTDGRQGSNIQKEHHHGGASCRSLAAWLLRFSAASPRQPLRKGLTEGGVEGFN